MTRHDHGFYGTIHARTTIETENEISDEEFSATHSSAPWELFDEHEDDLVGFTERCAEIGAEPLPDHDGQYTTNIYVEVHQVVNGMITDPHRRPIERELVFWEQF